MSEERALRVALHAVTRAGEYARRRQHTKFKVMVKADQTPVTVIDRAGEEIIRRAVSRVYPHDGFLGEEFGVRHPGAEARWILDPIDGTKSYIRRLPFWGTLLAREVRGRITLGVMYMPAMNKLVWAVRGRGGVSRQAPASCIAAPSPAQHPHSERGSGRVR